MTEPEDPYQVPIVPGPSYQPPPTAPLPVPPPTQPPPQVIYVQAPQGSAQVTRGIWDFMLQAWVIAAVAFFAVVLCCVGIFVIGNLGRQ